MPASSKECQYIFSFYDYIQLGILYRFTARGETRLTDQGEI